MTEREFDNLLESALLDDPEVERIHPEYIGSGRVIVFMADGSAFSVTAMRIEDEDEEDEDDGAPLTDADGDTVQR